MVFPDWYRGDLMRILVEELRKEQLDENEAHEEYMSRADELDKLSMYEESGVLRGIADDESRHSGLLGVIINGLEHQLQVEERAAGPRLFPQTEDDWRRLAQDIIDKSPDDSYWIKGGLGLFYYDESGGSDLDDFKRRLVGKAGELGIS